MKGDWIFSGSGEEYNSSVCVAVSGVLESIFSSEKKFALLKKKSTISFNLRDSVTDVKTSKG